MRIGSFWRGVIVATLTWTLIGMSCPAFPNWLIVAIIGVLVGHVFVEWARDDIRARQDELAAAAAREWRW